jgi:hypothetical protein
MVADDDCCRLVLVFDALIQPVRDCTAVCVLLGCFSAALQESGGCNHDASLGRKGKGIRMQVAAAAGGAHTLEAHTACHGCMLRAARP